MSEHNFDFVGKLVSEEIDALTKRLVAIEEEVTRLHNAMIFCAIVFVLIGALIAVAFR